MIMKLWFKYRYIFDLFFAQSAQEHKHERKNKYRSYQSLENKHHRMIYFIQQKLLILEHFNKINGLEWRKIRLIKGYFTNVKNVR